MTLLGAVISEAIVHHYGRDELLRRLAHPFWFQSFGAIMGMDWHSSGITTSVISALKRGLGPFERELGIHVCGGRGKYSRQTPQELVEIGDRVGFGGAELATASRLVAKVDSAAVQDGFQLYLHGFIVTDEGHWAIAQQGMNGDLKQARRYHWLFGRHELSLFCTAAMVSVCMIASGDAGSCNGPTIADNPAALTAESLIALMVSFLSRQLAHVIAEPLFDIKRGPSRGLRR
jgi:hypothetical protein